MNDIQHIELSFQGRRIKLEYQWIGQATRIKHPVIFLHEGLGSLSLWKTFPNKLCAAIGASGLVFSRYGYGNSTAKHKDEYWPVEFMHQQANEVLPQLFQKLEIGKPWLFGHSDGASIALLYASAFPEQVSGLIVLAPHVFVEDVCIRSIESAKQNYLTTDLKDNLGRHHSDPDSAFWGWNDIWLNPDFKYWNIEQDLASIRCPVLAIQGEDDEYGTLAQIDAIKNKIPVKTLVLPDCGHSPHRDQPEKVIDGVVEFLKRYSE